MFRLSVTLMSRAYYLLDSGAPITIALPTLLFLFDYVITYPLQM